MTLTIIWTVRHTDVTTVSVIGESEKGMQIRNTYSGKTAWIPKSGLKQYVPADLPGVSHRDPDPSEKIVADWFRAKCTHQQMAALGFAE
jgi:hypothetical protein